MIGLAGLVAMLAIWMGLTAGRVAAASEQVQWAAMKGTMDFGIYPFYGTQGVPNRKNCPGPRMDAVSWTNPSGALWLFGGVGIDCGGNRTTLGDLWRAETNSRTCAGEWGLYQ
jgi:hypothetical protein